MEWTTKEKERLGRLLDEAKAIQKRNQTKAGMPALLFLGCMGGSGKRRKRRTAWGVMEGREADAENTIRVGCAEKEVLEVPTEALQPVQVF